jgi:hypothetical protein
VTAAELERIRSATAQLEAEVRLVVGRGKNLEQNERAASFARALRELAPRRLSMISAEAEDPEGASLGLSRGGRTPVRFRIVPEGLELEVFLGALLGLAASREHPSLLELAAPLSVEVMTLPACGHCAPIATSLCRLAIASERLQTCVVDLQQAPQYVSRYGLTFTPAVIVNRKIFARKRTAGELAAELAAIAAGEHERFALAARLEAGEAAQVARGCLAEGRLAPGLCSLVAAENFQTRLGAIVALQEVARQSPELAAAAVAQVAALLKDAEPRNRGDAAFVLGELGRPEALPHLERLLADRDPEVIEGAREAMARLAKSLP